MPASSVGAEIKHLKGEKGYPQKRAVAAALSMARRGDFGKSAKRRASKGLARLYKEG
mgnify:CR=1 FL=1